MKEQINERTVKAIKQLREIGTPLKDIASQTGVSLYTAWKYQAGVEKKESPEDKERKLMEKLMEKFGISNKLDVPKRNKPMIEPYRNGNPENVLVVGDLHVPRELEGYLEFCRAQQERFDCGTVIFIGDIVDFHALSYHEHNPNLPGIDGELKMSKSSLENWYYTFPQATVTLGNHDLLPKRKGFTMGLHGSIVKGLDEILGSPKGWKFVTEIELNGVLYTHGTSGDAFKKALSKRISTVQGHLHTELGVRYQKGRSDTLFGMQVGCGIDAQKEAFEYGRGFKDEPTIGCGVVLDSGKLPLVINMDIG